MKLTIFGTERKNKVRGVKAGEELTCDYGYDPNNQVILIIIVMIIMIIFIIFIFTFTIFIFIIVFAGSARLVSTVMGGREERTSALMQIAFLLTCSPGQIQTDWAKYECILYIYIAAHWVP